MPYVIGNETFEKLATIGLMANFMVFLLTQFHLKQVFATNVINIWSGTANFAPLIGAFISDAYLGRFRTIAYSSIASFLSFIPRRLKDVKHSWRDIDRITRGEDTDDILYQTITGLNQALSGAKLSAAASSEQAQYDQQKENEGPQEFLGDSSPLAANTNHAMEFKQQPKSLTTCLLKPIESKVGDFPELSSLAAPNLFNLSKYLNNVNKNKGKDTKISTRGFVNSDKETLSRFQQEFLPGATTTDRPRSLQLRS